MFDKTIGIHLSKLTLTRFNTWFLLTSSLESSLGEDLGSTSVHGPTSKLTIWVFLTLQGFYALSIKLAPFEGVSNCDAWLPQVLLILINFLTQICWFLPQIDTKSHLSLMLWPPPPPLRGDQCHQHKPNKNLQKFHATKSKISDTGFLGSYMRTHFTYTQAKLQQDKLNTALRSILGHLRSTLIV